MKRTMLAAVCLFVVSTSAFADGSAFTPLNFNDTSYNRPTAGTAVIPNTSSLISDEAVGNGNIQNAISQLENAQIDIRNDLLNCRTKYADVDAQYKLIKAERTALKQQLKNIEKRLNEIDKAKERIRKNML